MPMLILLLVLVLLPFSSAALAQDGTPSGTTPLRFSRDAYLQGLVAADCPNPHPAQTTCGQDGDLKKNNGEQNAQFKPAAYRYTWGLRSEEFTPRQVASRNYWLMVAGMYASATFDIEAFQAKCGDAGSRCAELNPILGRSRPRQYAVKFGLVTALSYMLFVGKRWDMQDREHGVKSGYPPWWSYGYAWIGLNTATGAYNLASGPPR